MDYSVGVREPLARRSLVVVLNVAVALAACGPPTGGASTPPAAAERRYRVPDDVGSLVVDAAAFAALSAAVRRDLEAELGRGELRGEPLTHRLFVLALLDALDDRWREAVAGVDRIAALDDGPAARAMRGLTIRVWARVWADARTHGGADRAAAFGDALERALAALPIDLVRDQLSVLRTMVQVFTPARCRQLVEQEVGPRVRHGSVSLDEVHAIAFQRYAVVLLVPVAAVIDAALARHGIAPAS